MYFSLITKRVLSVHTGITSSRIGEWVSGDHPDF